MAPEFVHEIRGMFPVRRCAPTPRSAPLVELLRVNTTTHPLSTYWLVHDRPHAKLAAIASFVPDAAYLVALAAGLVVNAPAVAAGVAEWIGGNPEGRWHAAVALGAAVWGTWASPATNFIAQKLLHNLLFASFFGFVAMYSRKPAWRALALGWMLHVWTDLTFHAADAYAVVWPLSSRVFPSPVSYWDPDHHGRLVGGALSLMAAALWIWLGIRARRVDMPVPRRGILRGACGLLAFASLVGAFAGPPPEERRSTAWVDDAVTWPDTLAPIAQAIAGGEPRTALELLRSTALPPDDSAEPPWKRHHERARQQLLQAYAQDLLGNREQALFSYRLAERYEAVGGVGDKARRYQAEVFRNERDPAFSRGWLVLFAIGLGMSAMLLAAVRRNRSPAQGEPARSAVGASGSSNALPPR